MKRIPFFCKPVKNRGGVLSEWLKKSCSPGQLKKHNSYAVKIFGILFDPPHYGFLIRNRESIFESYLVTRIGGSRKGVDAHSGTADIHDESRIGYILRRRI
jgi:hypothetical protein